MLKRIILLVTIFSSLLFANKNVIAEAKLDAFELKDRSLKNVQKTLLREAKLKAANKLFGEVISSKTFVENGKLLEDYIYAAEGGVLHIKGDPVFENGDKLGEQKVMIMAYATDEDLDAMTLKKIELKDFTYANDELGLKQLKQAAQDHFVLEAIAKKNPGLKTQKNGIAAAKKLAMNVQIDKLALDVETASYKVSGFVEYIPAFVQNGSKKTTVETSSVSNFDIVKNKAILIVNSTDGKQKSFEFDYVNNGIKIPKKALSYMEKTNQKQHLVSTINLRLQIPNEIEENTVTIVNNGKSYFNESPYSYQALINGQGLSKNSGHSFSTEVIHNGDMKYVKLNVRIETDKGRASSKYYKNGVINNLSKLSFSIEDSEEKLIPFYVKSDFKTEMVVKTTKGKLKAFELFYTNDGITIPKKAHKFMKAENQKSDLITTVNMLLKVPDEITTNVITIKNNGHARQNESPYSYDLRVNGQGNSKDNGHSYSTEVIHDNGNRYVNLSLMIESDKGRFISDKYLYMMYGILANVSLIATDSEDGEKWFELIPFTQNDETKLPVVIKHYIKKNNEKTISNKHNLLFKNSAYLFDKKSFKYIFLESGKKDMMTYLDVKLKVPSDIKTDTITIKNNGYGRQNESPYSYNATINGLGNSQENGYTYSVDVKGSAEERFVDLHLAIETDKGRAKSDYYLFMIAGTMSSLSFIATDSENGEKWYALKPMSK